MKLTCTDSLPVSPENETLGRRLTSRDLNSQRYYSEIKTLIDGGQLRDNVTRERVRGGFGLPPLCRNLMSPKGQEP